MERTRPIFFFPFLLAALVSVLGCPPDNRIKAADAATVVNAELFENFSADPPPCKGVMQQLLARDESKPRKPGKKNTSEFRCVSPWREGKDLGGPIVYRVESKPCPSFVDGWDRCQDASDCEPGKDCICAGWAPSSPDQKEDVDTPYPVFHNNSCLEVNCPDGCNGLGCAEVYSACGLAKPGFRCHTVDDECGGLKGNCDGKGFGMVCDYDKSEGRWICVGRVDCYKE